MNYKIYTNLPTEGDWIEHKDKGFVKIYLDLDNLLFRLGFIDVFTLRTEFPENYTLGDKYSLDPNDIVIPEVTKEEVKKTIALLIKANYFDRLKPLVGVRKIEDLKEKIFLI